MSTATLPHCPTCRCHAPGPWLRYSETTKDFRECYRCGAITTQPGAKGWRFRHRAPEDPARSRGRSSESLCAECAAKEPGLDVVG